MQTTNSGQHAPPKEELIDQIRRRLIQIHVALASATDDDREIRRSTMRRVMDLLNDITPREPSPERDGEPARQGSSSGP